MLDEVHEPAGDYGSTHEEDEAEGAETDHHAGLCALRDPEDDGRKEGEEQDRAEVSEDHDAFLPLARE
jgi:hypothetical protein